MRLVQQVRRLHSANVYLSLTPYQEPVLFNGTVFENLCNGLAGTSWEHESRETRLARAQEAAKTAFAHDFINELPQGYDTRIGERGGLLSGGQKQRIAIARSIISQPKILLLDEATSALDPHAEAIVQKALNAASKDRTTLVIAHKLKTIQTADNIVVMKQGKIEEQGRHYELLARGGAYARLVKTQDLYTREKAMESESPERGEREQDGLSLEKSLTLDRHDTDAREKLGLLVTREDYGQASKRGIWFTACRLVRETPELRGWYLFALLTSIVGCKSLSDL